MSLLSSSNGKNKSILGGKKMIDKIRKEVDQIFCSVPHTRKVQELKEELVGNLEAKYKDLIEVGKTPEEAYNIVIASIGDTDELIDSMAPTNILDSKSKETKRGKKVKITKICLWSFIVIILGGILSYFTYNSGIDLKKGKVDVSNSNKVADTNGSRIQISTSDTSTSDMNIGHMRVAKEEMIQLGSIDFINMKLASADVEVSFIEGNEIRVIENTNDEEENELFEMSQSGNTLNIIREEAHHIFSFGNRPYHKVEIFIPISFKEKLAIETSSGDITLLSNTYLQEVEINTTSGALICEEEIEVSKANLSSTSGDRTINQLKTMSYSIVTSSGSTSISYLEGNGNVECTSGDLSISKITGENHSITTSSGEIEIIEGEGNFTITSSSGYKNLGHLVGGIHHITSSSGDVDIEKFQGDGNIETTSGTIEINNIINGKIEIKTSSGRVIVSELEGCGKISSASGEISIDIIKLQGDVIFNTASGKVDIRASAKVNADIEIETSSGDIEGNIEADYNKNKNKATAQFGNGKENTIKIATSSGDIGLRQD